MAAHFYPHLKSHLKRIEGSCVLSVFLALIFVSNSTGSRNLDSEIVSVSGAGATFPYPVYAKWAKTYMQIVRCNLSYQPVGSGSGIAQIKAGAVDFGASDEPLRAEELKNNELLQFPMIMGAIVPIINIGGVRNGELKLTPELLADIFLGKIKKWNDRRIMMVNPDLRLPEQEITVAHRADGSGTTWIFTNYLSKVSTEWQTTIGNDKSVSWVTGIGARGNQGVAAIVKKISGSIGYVEYAYAFRDKMNCVQLQNKAGRFVAPTMDTFRSTAANATWDESQGFYMVLTDQAGDNSWPIMGVSYILVHRNQANSEKSFAMMNFFDWCFRQGQDLAIDLHYVPIPPNVYDRVQSQWSKEIFVNGAPVWKANSPAY